MKWIISLPVIILIFGAWSDISICSAFERGRGEGGHPQESNEITRVIVAQNIKNVLITIKDLRGKNISLEPLPASTDSNSLPDKGKTKSDSLFSRTDTSNNKFIAIGYLAGQLTANSALNSNGVIKRAGTSTEPKKTSRGADAPNRVRRFKYKIQEIISLVDLTISTAGGAAREMRASSLQEGQAIGAALQRVHSDFLPIKQYDLVGRIKFYLQEKKNNLTPRDRGILMGKAILTFGDNWEVAASEAGISVFESGGTWPEMESVIIALFENYTFQGQESPKLSNRTKKIRDESN
jgi:hypothetical protein